MSLGTKEELRALLERMRAQIAERAAEPDWRAIADELAEALALFGCDACDGTCRDCHKRANAALAKYVAAKK